MYILFNYTFNCPTNSTILGADWYLVINGVKIFQVPPHFLHNNGISIC